MRKATFADIGRVLGLDAATLANWKHRKVAGLHELREASLAGMARVGLVALLQRQGRGIEAADSAAKAWLPALNDLFTGTLRAPDGESCFAVELRGTDGSVLEDGRLLAPGTDALKEAMVDHAAHVPCCSIVNLSALAARIQTGLEILELGAEPVRQQRMQRWADLPQAERDTAMAWFERIAQEVEPPRRGAPRSAVPPHVPARLLAATKTEGSA